MVHSGGGLRGGGQAGRGWFVSVVMMMVMVMMVMVVTVVVVIVVMVMVEKTGLTGHGVPVARRGTVIATGASCTCDLRLPAAERRMRGTNRGLSRVGGRRDRGGGGRSTRANRTGSRGGCRQACGRLHRRHQAADQRRRPPGRGTVLQFRRSATRRPTRQNR